MITEENKNNYGHLYFGYSLESNDEMHNQNETHRRIRHEQIMKFNFIERV